MPFLYDLLSATAAERRLESAVTFQGLTLSWRGLLKRVDRRAEELERMGIAKGDRVGLQLDSKVNGLMLALALSKLGALPVLIDLHADAAVLVRTPGFRPLRAHVTVSLLPPKVVPPTRVERLRGTIIHCMLVEASSALSGEPNDAPAIVMFEMDSENLLQCTERWSEAIASLNQEVLERFDLDAETPLQCTLPLSSCTAWDLAVLPALRVGATLVFDDDPSGSVSRSRALYREPQRQATT